MPKSITYHIQLYKQSSTCCQYGDISKTDSAKLTDTAHQQHLLTLICNLQQSSVYKSTSEHCKACACWHPSSWYLERVRKQKSVANAASNTTRQSQHLLSRIEHCTQTTVSEPFVGVSLLDSVVDPFVSSMELLLASIEPVGGITSLPLPTRGFFPFAVCCNAGKLVWPRSLWLPDTHIYLISFWPTVDARNA